jgi:hypothetical protein
MNDILDMLASVSGKREQALNIELAEKIASSNDAKALNVLCDGLQHKTKTIRHDCVKVLYEIAELNPGLTSPSANTFITLLTNKDNRMQWGAMTALSAMVNEIPEFIYKNLTTIIAIADTGTVITKDHAVKILVALSAHKKYETIAMPLLLEQILASPNNQLPSYAEQAQLVIQDSYKERFIRILKERLPEVTPDSKKKRVEKVLRRFI